MLNLIKSTFYNEKETKRSLNQFITQAKILSFSEQCLLFEQNFSKYQNRTETVLVNSGSSANLAILQALLNLGKIRVGDKVGFSAITWSTNVMPIIQLGLIPVPVDVEMDTLNVSSEALKIVLKKHKLSMLFLTNLLGFCSDIDEIAATCERLNILLIEDNCESLGTIYKKKKLGNFGYASTFSFYVGHHMSTIEGGAVCTDDDDLSTMLRLVRAHGWDRNLSQDKQAIIRELYKINSSFYSRYTFYDLGYNLRPTEITGFLGNNQLQYLDKICTLRRDNFLEIYDTLKENSDYLPLRHEHIDMVSNFAIPIVCKNKNVRKELVKKCDGLIEIRPIVGGSIAHQPFFDKYVRSYPDSYTKNARFIHENGLYFGNNPELTKKDIELIKSVFNRDKK